MTMNNSDSIGPGPINECASEVSSDFSVKNQSPSQLEKRQMS